MNPLWQRIQSSFDRQSFLKLLEARLEKVESGSVAISCRRKPELTQQQGFLHGGVVTTIADVTCGYSALTVLPEGREVLTVECKINLLRPVTGETILAKGKVLKAGKSLVVTEAEVVDGESGKLAAKMQATMIPAPASDPDAQPPAAPDVRTRLAPCGLHCGKCFAFQDGEIHDAAVRLKKYLGDFGPYAKRFETALDPVFAQYPAFAELLDYLAEASCGGCRVEKCKFYKNCAVRGCALEKQVDFCCECPEFPCEHTGLDENLYQRHVAINRKIAEIGAEAYYAEIKDTPRY